MSSWDFLTDVIIILASALVLGTIAEQLEQSAILGYLIAGTLIGPHVFGVVSSSDQVSMIAELGVAMLLFTIGLEFSFRRLRHLGRIAILGGSLQIVITLLLGLGVAVMLGVDVKGATAIGAMVALSSTACVMRVLVDRGAVDSVYGRNALGILLLQDIAVIPIMFLFSLLGGEGSPTEALVSAGKTIILAAALIGAMHLLLKYVVPRVLNIPRWTRNREFPILLAIVIALGSAAAAHGASLSPAMGAFIAGLLLGESPFAAQIRADVSSLSTLLVTLFFASIGMMCNPSWIAGNVVPVVLVVVLLIVGKTLVMALIARGIGFSRGASVATGLTIAQVGEFSFVLAEVARDDGHLISEHAFNVIISATIASLFLTPFLLRLAPRLLMWFDAHLRAALPAGSTASSDSPGRSDQAGQEGDLSRHVKPDIIIIGFGPAGQAAAQWLSHEHRDRLSVIELNPRTAAIAQQMGISAVNIGDATQRDMLEHAGIQSASVIAITLPDPSIVILTTQICRSLAPNAKLVVRERYHIWGGDIAMAGATHVVDEEEQVGLQIAAIMRAELPDTDGETEDGDRGDAIPATTARTPDHAVAAATSATSDSGGQTEVVPSGPERLASTDPTIS